MMQKQLNSNLFGETSVMQPRAKLPEQQSHLFQIEQKLTELQKNQQIQAQQMVDLVKQSNEAFRTFSSRLDQLGHAIAKLSEREQLEGLEMGQKITQIQNRMAERRGFDQKVQEMIDRHNGVLKAFEMRANHLQKLIGEKEAQILESQAALNEAKMEIARLKRV